MLNHRRSLLLSAAVLIVIAVCFSRLSGGSIHNSDDALYAQIAREAAAGHLFPLTFSGQPYSAKPPLFFWGTAQFPKVMGDTELAYRLPSALSLFAVLLVVLGVLTKLSGPSLAFTTLLLLLGSPLVIALGRRVMLDMPLTLCSLAVVISAFGARSRPWLWWMVGVFAALGWWTKELAILPSVLACGIFAVLHDRPALKRLSFWSGLGLFLISILVWRTAQARIPGPIFGLAGSVTSAPLPMDRHLSIYFDTWIADSLLLLLAPLAVLFFLFTREDSPTARMGRLLSIATVLQTAAPFLTSHRYPHYLLPAFVFGLIVLGLTASTLKSKALRAAFLVAVGTQALWTLRFLTSGESLLLNPARATKALSLAAVRESPPGTPLCAVDTYVPGFRFYSNRTVIGLYTTERAYSAMTYVAELRPFVDRISMEALSGVVQERCGGWAVMPLDYLGMLDEKEWRAVETSGPLTLAQALPPHP